VRARLSADPRAHKKAPPRKDAVSINDAILEVVALTRTEAANNGVLVRTQLAEGLPPVQGDRVQLQQVILNLILNAIEAMSGVGEGARQLFISTGNESEGVLVEVQDTGPGLTPATLDLLFNAFYTTEIWRFGAGIVDLPIDHRSAQWTFVGQSERSTWRHLSLRRTCPSGRRIVMAVGSRATSGEECDVI